MIKKKINIKKLTNKRPPQPPPSSSHPKKLSARECYWLFTESFRFWDEDYYEYYSALAWANVILAGKRDIRHSTTSFSENVKVVETSYQSLRSLIILRSENC